MGDPEQIISGAAELVRDPDILGRFLEQVAEQFAPGAERLFAKVFPFSSVQ